MKIIQMTRRVLLTSICTIVFLPTMSLKADDNLMQELERCRTISDNDGRLGCYDEIGKAPPADPTETDIIDAVRYKELTDDIGLSGSEEDNKTYLVTLSSCGVASNLKFYFYFDNGQVWRYVGGKKLRYRDCSHTGKVTEDRFGYFLQIDGETRTLRIDRVK